MKKSWIIFFLVLGMLGFSGNSYATNMDPQGPAAAEIKAGIISHGFHQRLAGNSENLFGVAKRLDDPAFANQLMGGLQFIKGLNADEAANLSNALLRASSVKYAKKDVNSGTIAMVMDGYRDLLNRTVLRGLSGASDAGNFASRGWMKVANLHVIHLVSAIVDYAGSANIDLTDGAPLNQDGVEARAQQNVGAVTEKPTAVDTLNLLRANVPEINALMQNPDIEAAALGIAGLLAKPSEQAEVIYVQPQPEAPMAAPQQVLYPQAPVDGDLYDNNVAGVSAFFNPNTGEALPSFVDEQDGKIYWYSPEGDVFTRNPDGSIRMI